MMNESLMHRVTLSELEEVVFGMAKGKAPGLDGFPIDFFQDFWDIINLDLLAAIQESHSSKQMLWNLNSNILVLIPKKEGANQLEFFRHIAVCNVVYKIITKLIAERLKIWLPSLISYEQGGFVVGRQIFNGVVISSKAIHSVATSRERSMFIKLNMAKAYDRVAQGVIRGWTWGIGFPKLSHLQFVDDTTLIGVSPLQEVESIRKLFDVYLATSGKQYFDGKIHAVPLSRSIKGSTERTDPKERSSLWEWMTSLPCIPWVIAGDFNMVEHQDNKGGGLPFAWKDMKKSHWFKMKNSLQLYDPLAGNKNNNPGPWYTWCNHQQGNDRIYSRLDRFYANRNLFSFLPNDLGNSVLVTPSTLSDHHPITASFTFNRAPIRPNTTNSKFLLNVSLLKDTNLLAAIHIINIINKTNFPKDLKRDIWNRNIPAWQNLLKTIGQKKAKDFRFTEKALSAELTKAEVNNQTNITDLNCTSQVIKAKDTLRRHLVTKTRGAKIRGKPPTSEINAEFLSLRWSPLKMHCLAEDITLGDINNAINSLKNDKTPGPDGLPIEFYKANQHWIAKDLLEIYNEALAQGSLGPSINKGIIKLIPKDGDKALIKNWRPITLLNVSYKIFAKILATRLAGILPKFICSTQTGFIKGRYILENVLTSWEAMNWASQSSQNSGMLLLDFEKAYDRIEWSFIHMMLEAFGFPPFFCKAVNMLLQDACTQIDINGSLSDTFPLGRSIRQGCPLAPALFAIASDALFYLLRDNTLSPTVQGISLPNNEELINSQFADDTAIFFKNTADNFENLQSKLKIFCKIFGAKILHSKSIYLGWNEHPPEWFKNYEFQWGGPQKIVKYLGIPFAINPSLKDMWLWVKGKITKKLNMWHNRAISFVGRLQVCQKILSSYNIYYSSAWMFSNYQIFEIQKAVRDFLWSDGQGKKKMHSVQWKWCCIDKLTGGLGLKDLRIQGISLAAKWIFHSMNGDAPWKILVRNNIERGFPTKAKFWNNMPFNDLVIGNFPISVQGSEVFKSIWKAWNIVRPFIVNKGFHDDTQIYGERSIWWNLKLSGKPLALLQGCSAKHWASKGIISFIDIFEHDNLISWEELKNTFSLPNSQKKTYNMILKATQNLPPACHVDSQRYLQCKWPDGTILSNIKANNIYKILAYDDSIRGHINKIWYSSLDVSSWKKFFVILWKGWVEPKIKCFKWLFILDRLPIQRNNHDNNLCKICNLPETSRHIFFDCSFARNIWNLFGIYYPTHVSIIEIVTGYIKGLKADSNIFWNILSSNILWQIWKCRNEEKFQDTPRVLTEFFLKLTSLKISLQVHTTMMMDHKKLRRFLQDGHATFFAFELKNGHEWRRNLDNLQVFEKTLDKVSKEIKRNRNSKKDILAMLPEIPNKKKVAWMEGEQGWTT
ncbi:uncharacterized protein LOC131872684 [Cryptomeria japonica]|uniref:uncharacterized protein LOC131872684 n=1 Tax=Cryptomeria japonica TaxID=3369 RepID=UPI0027DA302A|nr:uncharacterized protein LOC131872684 [Cryptomeria japonica]